jgi:hypothetical protein
MGGHKSGKLGKAHGGTQAKAQGRTEGSASEGTTVAPPATRSRHKTTPTTTMASLPTGSRSVLGDSSSNDKTDGWCLDTDATHHMTGRREFFTKLHSDVRGSVKFGDASGVEIKGIGSVIFRRQVW